MKYITIIIFSCFLLSCASRSADATTEQADTKSENEVTLDSLQLANAGVTITIPVVKNMHQTIRVNGNVDVPPQNLVSVSFPLGGYLVSTNLLPGSPVQKGQVIATMEDQSYVQLQQDYLTAKARLEYLANDVERQKVLSDADATSKKSYQLVLSDFKTQQAIIRSLEEKLRIININPSALTVESVSRKVSVYETISGYVTKVNVNIGKYITPSDVMFELVNPDDIHAAMTVFEKDILQFRKGMQGIVWSTDAPDSTFEVEVILVTKNVDDSRSGLMHCHFENPRHNLLPGMFLGGSFDVDGKAVTAVPQEAVVRYMGKEYVFVARHDSTFLLTPVVTGLHENGFTEISDNGEVDWMNTKVVVTGAYALLGKLKNKMDE